MAWSGRGGDGIRIACFVGQAVLNEVHARVVHASGSGAQYIVEGCALGVEASRPGAAGAAAVTWRGVARRWARTVHTSTLEGCGAV